MYYNAAYSRRPWKCEDVHERAVLLKLYLLTLLIQFLSYSWCKRAGEVDSKIESSLKLEYEDLKEQTNHANFGVMALEIYFPSHKAHLTAL